MFDFNIDWKGALAIIIVVVLALGAIGYFSGFHKQPTYNQIPIINVTQVNIEINYATPNSCHYFGNTTQIKQFKDVVDSGTGFIYNLSLEDWSCNPLAKHGFNSITVGPF